MSKPYLNLKYQLGHLKNKRIYIGNRANAKRILMEINFQRFLAYRVHFLDVHKKIKPNTKFIHIYKLHEFDKELRDLTGVILENIELNFRRHIAYVLGEDGVHSYLNNQNFRDHFKHAELLNSINKHIRDARNPNSKKFRKIVQHHLKNHQDDLPIYKAVEILSFGELSRFFENLKSAPRGKQPEYKDKIRKFYQDHKQNTKLNNKIMESWLRELVEVRNRCAHYDMLWDYQKQLMYLGGNKAWRNGVYQQSVKGQNPIYKFYGICLIFKDLCLNKKDFEKYMYNLEKLVKKYSNLIKLSDLGFPSTWKHDLELK